MPGPRRHSWKADWRRSALIEPTAPLSHLGHVAILAPGVPVTLGATKPELRCELDDPLPTQLRARRSKLGLSVEEAAASVGVRRWTFGLWGSGRQQPQARHREAVAPFLEGGP